MNTQCYIAHLSIQSISGCGLIQQSRVDLGDIVWDRDGVRGGDPGGETSSDPDSDPGGDDLV